MKKFFLAIVCVIFLLPPAILAEKNDTVKHVLQPIHKNIIKFNPTPMLLWSMKNVTLSYERILNPRQSISISIGYLEFPSLFKDTIVNLVAITSREKYGINVGMEYRFYLMKRNARPIPDGIYLAPYASCYGYHFKNNVDMLHTSIDSAGVVKGNFHVVNVGIELGYQFVFWKRLTLDFILIGPSLSYYGGGVDISGNINLADLKNLNEDFYNRLKEKYPMIGDFVVNKSFRQNGKLDLFSIGFRYLLQIGFHF
jgi:hypothetical protein